MQNFFKVISSNIKVKYKTYTIDNFIFKLHYRITMSMLFLLVVLVSSQELIGEHIKCMSDKGVPEAIMNRFCFFTSTFTVYKYLNSSMLNSKEVAHPGVGAMGLGSNESVKHHAYYQWVPFVLFGQAILFYIPHLIWKGKEGGRMKKLVQGLEHAAYATDTPMRVGTMSVPDKKKVEEEFDKLRKYFVQHMVVNHMWTFWLIFCEFLNLANLILNIYITDAFLGGQFWSFGHKLVRDGLNDSVDIFDVVFPKMTKCTFHKYGPSGQIQAIDAMCVMALNIINEKAYTVIWFWFMTLLVITILGILWRMITFCLYSQSVFFNRIVFSIASSFNIKFNHHHMSQVISRCNYRDWIFLVYLAKNLDPIVFMQFFGRLVNDYEGNLITLEENGDGDDYTMDKASIPMKPASEKLMQYIIVNVFNFESSFDRWNQTNSRRSHRE